MEPDKLASILKLVTTFAGSNDDILALGLCGSWAAGTAGPDSDIDLSIIVEDPIRFKKKDWMNEIGFEKINTKIDYFKDEVYGRVWSRHIFFEKGIEIEFSFADKNWANIENLDEGTRKVVSDGYKVLYDPYLILKRLVEKVMS